ncbi:tetratricopeptide repeat protein [Mucilaginibacter calamicampi]|uniref:Tetratricopeptide repeat protein n=1 Tax=Mucilaginibacter calamicampi TaxID=1302352 RepID=A0ABW2Z3Y0_9SPHI
MQTVFKPLLTAFLVFCSTIIFAQGKEAALLSEGLELQKAGKHAEAASKFKEVLQTEPDNAAANYQLAFSLVAVKNGNEAIPYAEKVTNTNSNYTAAAYSLLGGIYDASAQAAKAITVYSEGLKKFPTDQNMWFNIGLAFFRDKQYAEAEKAAIEAIKLAVEHANSQRLYALVAFHQNKRMNALLGLCSFLLTDPNSPRAEEAYTNIQSILKGGVLKGADTKELSTAEAKEAAIFNAGITTVINSTAAQKLSGVPLLEYQLKNIFVFAWQATAKKADKSFFDKFFVSYFYKLAQSNNAEALSQLINKNADGAAYEKWRQNNASKVSAFDEWVNGTPR